ncbi:hypothetical protein YH63_008365 [Afipia massiliensis]|uniref:Uncharacterized protein n=1 Tax=Afipia massiliensis TaxID=211460 RepID=A0A4U6BPM1_9BRAD|nr:hypothetical protein [Afipia massiliensis]TKT71425.1 hypothetical protein YH63_008365 [Afipia massiliensis]
MLELFILLFLGSLLGLCFGLLGLLFKRVRRYASVLSGMSLATLIFALAAKPDALAKKDLQSQTQSQGPNPAIQPIDVRLLACGAKPCRHIDGRSIVENIQRQMHQARTDCREVRDVFWLPDANPNLIDHLWTIYMVVCSDAKGDQLYQVVHAAADREIVIRKFSGDAMDTKTIKSAPFNQLFSVSEAAPLQSPLSGQ